MQAAKMATLKAAAMKQFDVVRRIGCTSLRGGGVMAMICRTMLPRPAAGTTRGTLRR
jgi:hypothetical protein